MIGKSKLTKKERKERRAFFTFIFPWIFGFICITLGPILASIYLSFTDWNLFTKPNWIGVDNYVRLFTEDRVFWKSVYNTFYYAMIAVPLMLLLSLIIAFLLDQKVKHIRVFRTIYYLPAVVPAVASAMIFKWLLAPSGLINKGLALLGIDEPSWLLDVRYVKISFVFMAIWGVGASMILLLSGMQGIPKALYESAAIDGAGRVKQFIKITIPMLTPVLFFNLIMGIISSLQTFSQIYILTEGGPNNSSMMIVPYLYENAFGYYRMGYASSISWVLFLIIMLLTLLVFKSSGAWVFYEGEVKK